MKMTENSLLCCGGAKVADHFSRELKHVSAGGCKQKAKCTLAVNTFSTKVQHENISNNKIQSGTFSEMNFISFTLQNATMNQSKRVFFLCTSILASLNLSVSCTSVTPSSVVQSLQHMGERKSGCVWGKGEAEPASP